MIEFFHLENQQPTEKNNMSQFGPTSVPHCGGRACVRCGKCRDWYYVGNNWNHILNWKNWNDDDRALYWGDNGDYKNWNRRHGAFCHDLGLDGDGLRIHFRVCVCPDNNQE